MALSDLTTYARLLMGLPRFMARRMSLDEAREVVRERMATRARTLVDLTLRNVFSQARSPYRVLMEWAGLTGDSFQRLVEQKGVEGSLAALRDAGVYVTFEEYKGRCPIVRGSRTLETDEAAFRNPQLQATHGGETGGSSGRPARMPQSLEATWESTPGHLLSQHASGVFHLPLALCRGPLPGSGTTSILSGIVTGHTPDAWFDPPRTGGRYPFRFWLADFSVHVVARMSGHRVPRPVRMGPGDAIMVARWAREAISRSGGCFLSASASLALRISLAAREAGIDLTGAVFSCGGEPLTIGKQRGIEASGARCLQSYWSTDAGFMGAPCTTAVGPPAFHLQMDTLAMIQRHRFVPGAPVPVEVMLFTSLRPSNSQVLLNTEIDDYAVVEEATCDCPQAQVGFMTVLREIRSVSKQTGEGVTLVGSDLAGIVDNILPNLVGGSPLDYQFVEEEDGRGFTRLTLRVSPRVGIVSEEAVLEIVNKAIDATSLAGQVAGSMWRAAGTLRLIREEPRWTNRSKLLPLDIERPHAGSHV